MAACGPLSTVTSTRVPLTRAVWGPSASRMAPVRGGVVDGGQARPRGRWRRGRPSSTAGVPSAMTRPWSMTASVLASRSASSRYWVVSRTVVPPPTRLLDDLPQVVAALGVEPGGRLVEEEHGRAGHQGGGQVEAPAHAARVGLERPVAGIGQVELGEQLDGPLGDDGARRGG